MIRVHYIESVGFEKKNESDSQITGLVVPAFYLIVITYLGDARVAVVSLLIIGGGLEYLSMLGYFINMLDLSPKFAGNFMILVLRLC